MAFLNKHSTLQIFLNQPKTACCNEWLQLISLNNRLSFIQYIHAWNPGGIIADNYDISLQQLMFWKNAVNLKERVTVTAVLY